jgi:alanyl-tRNA synthetase
VDPEVLSGGESEFTGYDSTVAAAAVKAISMAGGAVTSVASGEEAIVVLDKTPFYPESGGQVGDEGSLRSGDAVFEVRDTQKLGGGVIGHFGRLVAGSELAVNDQVSAEVQSDTRARTMRNHSATHLLHAALKSVLGRHVEQKGSLVEGERLRFDFSHPNPVSAVELAQIEDQVNREIRSNVPVETRVMALEDAKASGAEALFGEKYEDNVRVVNMGEFSCELCGGTHVARTGDIGVMFITSESGVAAGVRRIEAVTGAGATDYVRQQLETLDSAASMVAATRSDLPAKLQQLSNRIRRLEKDKAQLQEQLATGGGQDLASQARDVNGVKVIAARLDGADARAIRTTIDRLRDKLGDSVVVLAGSNGEKTKLIAGVSRDLTDRVHAGKLISELVHLAGGRGGGRPDMAEGGIPEDGIDTCLAQVVAKVKHRLGS